LRTVVIGTGRMGRRHIQAAQELGLEIVGVFDKQPESLALAAKERELPAAKLFCDSVAMFRSTAPECAIVATTTDSHYDFTCEAVRSGAKYILCEKPMAGSLAQCDAMIEICRQHGTRLAVNHHFRLSELHQSTKRALQSELLGGLTSVTIVAGNVGMAMIGTHMFDLFHFMSGEASHEVSAWLSPPELPNPRGVQFQDPGGAVRITTRSGKRCYMEAGTEQGHGIVVDYGAKYGQIVLDLLQGSARILRRQDTDRSLPSTQYGTPSVRTSVEHPIGDAVSGTKAVLHNLLNGGEFPSGVDGQQAIAVLVAAYASHENGHRPVRVDEPVVSRGRIFPWP
jgi:predicted dehydrogenase